MHVVARGRVTLYEARGEFQLVVEHLEEAGEGALKREFEKLKAKLAAEGLFAAERKRPLPAVPRRIGVVSSPTGAAIHDILRVLKARFPGAGVLLYPTAVQGAAAVPEKQVKSLHVQFARDGVAPNRVQIDVAVLHDGGTYATCDVRVTQSGRVLADATVSLHVPGKGPAQQSIHRRYTDPLAAKPQRLGLVPCETRVVDGVDLKEPAVGPAEFAFWMRSADLDAPIEAHQALANKDTDQVDGGGAQEGGQISEVQAPAAAVPTEPPVAQADNGDNPQGAPDTPTAEGASS